VELSDGKDDFASTVGVGGVIGTKFTWPKDPPADPRRPNRRRRSNLLTAEKDIIWKKWFNIYSKHMLPKGEYLGALYDIGFDKPESHAIKNDSLMYYAFYAEKWQGRIELRGLERQEYSIVDYVNDKNYGTVMGPNAGLDVSFERNLLLLAKPK
jgi:alpha-galactosidase